jgi:hypothetical protein
MGQDNIIGFLKLNHLQWFSAKDIASKMDLSQNAVDVTLLRLRRHKEVYFRYGRRKVNSHQRMDVLLHKYKR